MPSTKLTRSEAARLAGLESAHRAGSEGMKARGARGGDATYAAHGKAHMLRMSLKRWGRDVKQTGELASK